MPVRRLIRLRTGRTIGGVCAGLAEYFQIDVVFVRAAWVVFSIVPGVIVGGVLAYLAAWLIIPEGADEAASTATRRLRRSATDRQIAGVCGGVAEYLGVDATPIRLLWVLLSIFCGAVVGGVIMYLAAWLIIPDAHDTRVVSSPPGTPPASIASASGIV